jgi:LysM repeat protein
MGGALQLFFGFMDHRLIDVNLSNGKTAQIKYADAWTLDEEGYLKLKDGIDPEWSNQSVYHNFVAGESLASIAKKYGTTEEALKKKNRLDDNAVIEPGTELIIATSEKFKRFRNEFAGTSHLLYGAYDAFAQPEGDAYMLYRMFFFMRKWATPMFVNKWGADIDTSEGIFRMKVREKYNWELARTRMGYYTKTLQTIVEMVRSKGDKYNYLTDKEKIAMKKSLADVLQMIAYSLIVAMLFGYDSDDDDRWEKLKARSGPLMTPEFNTYGFLANHTMLLLLGVQAETSAFLPLPKIGDTQFGLDDYSKFLTQTSSAFGNTLILYAKIFQDIFNTVLGDESARYKRDSGPYWWQEKDTLKIWGHVFKTVGFTGGTGDPVTLTKNLENSGVKIG